MKSDFINNISKKIAATTFILLPAIAFAQSGPKKVSELYNPVAISMIAIAILLLGGIFLVSNTLMHAAKEKLLREVKEKKEIISNTSKVVLVLVICCTSASLFAQSALSDSTKTVITKWPISGLSETSFYVLTVVIVLEIIILLGLISQLRNLLVVDKVPVDAIEGLPVIEKDSAWKKLWIKLNSFKSLKEEESIDLGHNYDGIRELDNRLPPWWIWGFYATILFACIYLWQHHVSHSEPLALEEYKTEMMQGEEDKLAFLAKSKDKVDENTVQFMSDAADLDAGKQIFTTICAACHRPDGGGVVGPNLTDDYWLHGGSVKDIFKTIKYGYPDKGMKSWETDYSPKQIAQLSSYVKSIHGSNPPTPKEPQGELYKEENQPPSTPAVDSSKKNTVDNEGRCLTTK